MKRYCQTLELRDDPEMIDKYCEAHAHVWPEIQAGIREVGILDMQIYRLGTRLFMIMDTVGAFTFRPRPPPRPPRFRAKPNGKPMWRSSRAATPPPPRPPNGG